MKIKERQTRSHGKFEMSRLPYLCKPSSLKMPIYVVSAFLLAMVLDLHAQPNGEALLRRIDKTMTSETKIVVSKMIVHGRRSSRTMVAKSWIKGEDESFSEYLAPAREKGTKMLKLGDQLWTYSPQTDRTIRISGHMLRQSLMGSDLSYEDMMEDPKMANLYTAEVTGTEEILGRPCWIVRLDAKKEDIAYHSRKIWVDKERYLVLREERFAKSGKLLKTATVDKVAKIGGKWVAAEATFKDMLQTGKGTQFIIESIEFDVPIPGHILSKASLRK